MGPERLGQVDAGQRPARQPGLRGDRGPDPASRARTSPTGPPTCGARPACSWPSSTPRRSRACRSPSSCARRCRPGGASTSRCSSCGVSIMEWMKRLGMDPSFGDRYLNEGFSGGEKKRNEILQMAILEPELAILDETDSGLDIDALGVVARGRRGGAPGPARARRAGRHPLPAHPRPAAPDVRPPADRRAHRRPAAARSWPAGSRRKGTRHGAEPTRRPPIKKDFPILDRQVHGQRLVYLDSAVLVAEAGGRDRGHDPLLRDDPRQRAPGRVRHRRGGHPPVRGGRGHGGALHRRPAPTRWCSPRTSPRPSTWSPTRGAGPTCSAGDVVVLTEMEHHANIVPWLILKAERGIELRYLPIDRRRAARPDRPRPDCSTAPSCSACHRHVERARHDQPHPRSSPTRPTPPAPWSWSTAAQHVPAPADRRDGPRRRLLRLHRPQDARARPASACCGPAPSCSRPCRPSSAAAR